MTDAVNEPECDEAVSQQAQGPALPAFRRRATGERNQVGFHLARHLLGRARRQRFIVERRGQARGQETAAHIADGVPMTLQGLSDGLILERLSVVAIQEQEDPGSCLGPSRSAA